LLQVLGTVVFCMLLYNLFDHKEISSADRMLMDAVELGDLQAAQSAIERGAEVNRRNWSGSTPLHTAAWRGDLAMARLLIAAGAHLDISNSRYGETPLHSAARGVEPAMMAFLLETGADPYARTHTDSEQCNGIIYPAGATALDIARMNGLSQWVYRLTDKHLLVQEIPSEMLNRGRSRSTWSADGME
jgi:ankyrin repeat protein